MSSERFREAGCSLDPIELGIREGNPGELRMLADFVYCLFCFLRILIVVGTLDGKNTDSASNNTE